MSWLFLSAICLVLATIALATWRKWIAPWRSIEQLVREVAGGQRPRTFLVDGGTQAQRVAVALARARRRPPRHLPHDTRADSAPRHPYSRCCHRDRAEHAVDRSLTQLDY